MTTVSSNHTNTDTFSLYFQIFRSKLTLWKQVFSVYY